MSMVVLAIVVEVALFAAVAGLRLRSPRANRRHRARFAAAADEARRLAYNALIVEASVAELAELVIEESLREIGMDSGTEWSADWSIEAL
ncbi:MAG: hypothetical protein ACYDD4_04630 [Acidimicrobiales bacterium]